MKEFLAKMKRGVCPTRENELYVSVVLERLVRCLRTVGAAGLLHGYTTEIIPALYGLFLGDLSKIWATRSSENYADANGAGAMMFLCSRNIRSAFVV